MVKKNIKLSRTNSHQKFYVTNVMGGLTSHDIRFELLNEVLESDDEKMYVSDALVILTPMGAKRLQKELNEIIQKYEQENGEIPLNPKKETKIKVK